MFNSAKGINNEWGQNKFLNVTKSLETGTSLIAELAELNKEVVEKDFERFIEFIKLLDRKRNINIKNYLQEWVKIF